MSHFLIFNLVAFYNTHNAFHHVQNRTRNAPCVTYCLREDYSFQVIRLTMRDLVCKNMHTCRLPSVYMRYLWLMRQTGESYVASEQHQTIHTGHFLACVTLLFTHSDTYTVYRSEKKPKGLTFLFDRSSVNKLPPAVTVRSVISLCVFCTPVHIHM